MSIFIMLCGQGGSGKSTFSKKIKEEFPYTNIQVCAIDNIVPKSMDKMDKKEREFYYKQFIAQTQEAIDQDSSVIIVDFCFDTRGLREDFLSSLSFSPNTNFICIRMKPPIETIIKWEVIKHGNISPELIELISRVYNEFQDFEDWEFEDYGFASVNTFVVNPEYY